MTESTFGDQQHEDQPVLIPIHSDKEVPEWAMVELNGELIFPKDLSAQRHGKENPLPSTLSDNCNNNSTAQLIGADNIELGSLQFSNNKEPVMIVGTHQLKGVVEKLKKPFCVLTKQKEEDEKTSYRVTGLVTEKILFNQYPKTIMR